MAFVGKAASSHLRPSNHLKHLSYGTKRSILQLKFRWYCDGCCYFHGSALQVRTEEGRKNLIRKTVLIGPGYASLRLNESISSLPFKLRNSKDYINNADKLIFEVFFFNFSQGVHKIRNSSSKVCFITMCHINWNQLYFGFNLSDKILQFYNFKTI